MVETADLIQHFPPAGTPTSLLNTALIDVTHTSLAAVRHGGAATTSLSVLVLAAAVFLATSAWSRTSAGVRRDRVSSIVTVVRVAALVTVFGALTYQVAVGGWLTGMDEPLLNWLIAHRTAWLTGPAIAITDIGGPVGTCVLAIIVGAFLARRVRSWTPAIILIGTVGAAAILCTAVKALVGRERPPIATQVLLETDLSFPSGHVTGAMALLGMVAVLLGYGRVTAYRWTLLSVAGLLTAVVAATRLYLGEHWLTDVVGGAVLGGIAVLAGSAVYAVMAHRNRGYPALGTDTPPAERPTAATIERAA